MSKRFDQSQMLLPVLAELVQTGPNEFKFKMRAPTSLDTWVSPLKAMEMLGFASRSTVYLRLEAGLLVYRKPGPKKIEISLVSIEEYKRATADPEFWENRELQKRLKTTVAATMKTLCGVDAKGLQRV